MQVNMSADEKYALNWSSYTDHIKLAFTKILEADDFVDVTLYCEGKKIKAHRVILSACSPYFYDILKDNPGTHPTIVLRDIQYSNIKYILKFMYCGEVDVPTELFSSFLQTAEFLQVSGLTGNTDSAEDATNNIGHNNKTSSIDEKTNQLDISPQSPVAPHKRKVSETESVSNKKKKDIELSDSDEELSSQESKEDTEVNNATKSMSMENVPNIEKLLNDSSFLSKDTNPECECPVCGEKFISIYMLKQHVPYHLGETKCPVCGKVLGRLDILKKHLLQTHKILTPGKKDR